MNLTGTRLVWLAVAAVVLLIIGANAQMAYLAFATQPACVPHLKTGDAVVAAQYAAAKSSC